MSAVFGIARNQLQAETIVSQLQLEGFSNQDVSVLMPHQEAARPVIGTEEIDNQAPEGLVAGGISTGIVGGVLGWLAGIGALAIPGIGPFIAAGPIMAALSGAAAGAAAGGIGGTLIGLGVPRYEADVYRDRVATGQTLIAVHSVNELETTRARDVLRRLGARDIYTRNEAEQTA